ncbi:MAG TPA: methylenetetrahydrofolate reductase, partial [Deinococcales bacterium]|nr:methylenetetrahydrofolate reductase [Deinococcales bacterium]
AVNISDSPQANLRMAPIAAAAIVQQQAGLEVIVHLTCRDRNVLGLQAELLGAAALGVRNVLVLRGDPPERGDHPEARGVFELTPPGLARVVKGLNGGVAASGRELEGRTGFAVGVAANPGAADLAREVEGFLAKVEAGADFAQTQPVFDARTVERFLNALGSAPIPVLYGVLPVRSVEMADRVGAWTGVPEALRDDLRAQGRRAGLAWASRVVADLRALGVPGVHLYPLGRASVVAQVLGPLTDPVARVGAGAPAAVEGGVRGEA